MKINYSGFLLKKYFMESKNLILFLFFLLPLFSCTKSKKINSDSLNKISHFLELGQSEFKDCNYLKSKMFFDSAEFIIKNNDTDYLTFSDSLPKILNHRGNINRIIGRPKASWNDFQNSLDIAEKNAKKFKKELFNAYFGLGVLFFYYQENNEMALDYFKNKANQYVSDRIDKAKLLYSQCESNIADKRNEDASALLKQLIDHISYDTVNRTFKNPNDTSGFFAIEPWIWESLAKIKALKNYDPTIIKENYSYSIALNQGRNSKKALSLYQVAGVLRYESEFLIAIQNYQEAKLCLENSFIISDSLNFAYNKMKAAKALSKLYSDSNDCIFSLKYLTIADSINTVFNNKELLTLSIKKINEELRKKEYDSQIRNIWIIIITPLIIILSLILVILKNRKNKIEDLNRDLETKKKELENEKDKLNLQYTQLKDAINAIEEQQRIQELLMKYSHDGIYLIQENKFVMVNESFCKITGYKVNDLIEKPYSNIIYSEDIEKVTNEVNSKLNGEEGAPLNFRFYTKSNLLRRAKSFSGSIEIKGIPSIYGYFRDVTEEEASKEELNVIIKDATTNLNDALKYKETLLDSVIHEIDSPTNAIKGNALKLRSKSEDTNYSNEARKKKLDDIIGFCDLLFMLAGNIVLSKNMIHIDKLDYNFPSLEQDIIKNAIYVIRSQVLNKSFSIDNVTLTFNSGPIYLRAKKNHFLQVFFNLLNNAVKYAYDDPKKFKIQVISENVTTGVKLTISDWGIGIPQGEEESIFKDTVRGSNAGKKLGMGLGLWVTSNILSAYSCKIKVTNNISPTVFEVFIPNTMATKHKFYKDF